MPDIRLDRVSKVFPGGVQAVQEIDLTVKDGEFMIFLGPSGCGKSTTLRMIAGLETISEGNLYFGEQRMNEVDPKDRDLAFVFQNYALFPHMTVRGNLGFGMKLRKVERDELARRLAEVSGLLGIDGLLDRKPSELSGGQRQRVALGRALLRDPHAFLLDEPLSNLDAKLRSSMRTELIKLHRRIGRTIIHVTHDQVEAMTMGERICIMNEGRIVQVGPPIDVYRRPADTFVAGFLANPPMNLLDALVTTEGLRLEGNGVQIPVALDEALGPFRNRRLIMGIRPEDLYTRPFEGGVTVDVETVALEALGPEVILIGRLPGSGIELAARLDRDFQTAIGVSQRLYLDASRLHLFDPMTTKRIEA